MKIYNTLSRQKEELQPITGNDIRMYSCGPTVYGFAHIGNMRTYIFMDLLRRALKSNGYNLTGVMNITDVGHLTSDGDAGEDKMEKGARREGKTPWEIAEFYTNAFMADCGRLHIDMPEITPKATDNIQEMIEYVQELVALGYGYETSDGIYFDIAKFPNYGKLSGINLEDQKSGARVEVNVEKRNPADFALWKKAPKEHIMQWPSPWGMGYPGWHIECSVMSRKYLGEYFDIHTGGVDHIPIHHENEIAQSEAINGGNPAVKYWMHSEFMMVNNGKMSKSLGNVWTVSDLEKMGIPAMAFRYFCLNAHYRNKLNYTEDSIRAAVISCGRFYEGAYAHKGKYGMVDTEVINKALADFFEAVNDDLNVPKALGIAWNLIKSETKSDSVWQALVKMDEILGLDLAGYEPPKADDDQIPAEVQELLDQRAEARKTKNWALSDEIRNKLSDMGYVVKDSAEGQKLEKK